MLSATNIVLIGFMGSGKSSVARALAKKSDYYFIDTDALIESSEGKEIDAIFKDKGEAYFRKLEEDTVHWLSSNVQQAIISTGGGMLVYCEALKEVGKIVYLRVPFSTIMSRMNPAELAKRPLFQDVQKAESMYNERNSIYEKKADLMVDAEGSIEEVLTRLSSVIA